MFYRDAEAAKVEPVNTSQEVPTQGLVSPVRRRLLQGSSLALPAILTLHSGSASAAVSLTCRVKEFNNAVQMSTAGLVPPGIALVTTVDTPDYMRVRLQAPPKAPFAFRYPVRGTDNSWARGSIIYFDHIYDRGNDIGGTWRKISDGSVVSPNPSNPVDPRGSNAAPGQTVYGLAFYHVDTLSQPPVTTLVALGPTKNAGTVDINTVCISDTCFASA